MRNPLAAFPARKALTETVGRVLAELDVEDLTVTDPPIEDVIARLFASGNGKASQGTTASS